MKKLTFLLMLSFIPFYFSLAEIAGDLIRKIPVNSREVNSKKIATKVFFSNEEPILGIAKENKELFIKSEGGFAYLIVDNYPDNFTYDQLQVKVYKRISGENQSFDNKTYNISTSNYYTYIKYVFYSTGYYIFDVFNKYGTLIGSTAVTISDQTSSSSVTSEDCISGYKEYYSSVLGFAMCAPKDSYADESKINSNKITFNNFYGKKLEVSFMQEPTDGIDKFDASVVDVARDLLKTYYSSYYRKEFKMLSSKGDLTIYRSVISATSSSGSQLQCSVFYVRMYGKKIRGYDYMKIIGPHVSSSDDVNYQIIIELGMLSKLKIY